MYLFLRAFFGVHFRLGQTGNTCQFFLNAHLTSFIYVTIIPVDKHASNSTTMAPLKKVICKLVCCKLVYCTHGEVIIYKLVYCPHDEVIVYKLVY